MADEPITPSGSLLKQAISEITQSFIDLIKTPGAFVPDKYGVRKALMASFVLMLISTVLFSGTPTIIG